MDVAVSPLAQVRLGDLVTLPDGRSLSVRARAALPVPVGSMAGFMMCGEFECLLALPTAESSPVNVYAPLAYMPEQVAQAPTVYEGACSYWAPHLPGVTSAMGELLYCIKQVRGSVDPAVILNRSGEPIPFVRVSFAYQHDLDVMQMPQNEERGDVRRSSSVVSHPDDIGQSALADQARRSLYERVVGG